MDQLSDKSKHDFANFLGFFLTEHFLILAKDKVDRAIEDSHSFYAFIFNKFIDNENEEYKFLCPKLRAQSDKKSVFIEHEDFEHKLYIKSLALPIELDRMLGTESYRLGNAFRPVFDDLDFVNHLINKDAKHRQRHEIQSYSFEESYDLSILKRFRDKIRSEVLRQINSGLEYLLYLKDDESIFLADYLKTDMIQFTIYDNYFLYEKYYSHDSICSREQVLNIINNALAKDGYSDVDDILNTSLNNNSVKKRLMKYVDDIFKREAERLEINFDLSPTINQYVLSRFDDLSQSKNVIDFTSWCFFACLCSGYLRYNHTDPHTKIEIGISANSKIVLDILSYDSNKSWIDDMFNMVDSNWGEKFKYTNENTYMSICPDIDLRSLVMRHERRSEVFEENYFLITAMFDFIYNLYEAYQGIDKAYDEGFNLFENCNYVYMGMLTKDKRRYDIHSLIGTQYVRYLFETFCENFKEAVIVINIEE